MFEQEHCPQQQISREAAERYASTVAVTARRAEAKRVRRQRRAVRQTRSSAAEAA